MVLLPVGRRAIGMVGLQRLLVIGALVAEQCAEGGKPLRVVADQAVPVIVAELMAEMAEQRAIVLAHLDAPSFALGRVRLGDIECDQAVVMAGQDARATRTAAIGSARKSKARPASSPALRLGATGSPAASSE